MTENKHQAELTASSMDSSSGVVGCSILVGGELAPPPGYEQRLEQALEVTRQSLQCAGVEGLAKQVRDNKTLEGSSASPAEAARALAAERSSRNTTSCSNSSKPTAEVREPGSNIGLCFNAGKDSIVTLELMIEVAGIETVRRMVLFMFHEDDEFPELVAYRHDYLAHFKNRGLDLVVVPKMGNDWARSLTYLKDKYSLEGVIIGTRSTDPDGKYQTGAIAPTTGKFPPMVRYCPVFHWLLGDVWYYLAERRLPICNLYAQGYTSLGSQSTTRPNPHLLEMNLRDQTQSTSQSSTRVDDALSPQEGENGTALTSGSTAGDTPSVLRYRPAWELQDCLLERAGRGKKPCLE